MSIADPPMMILLFPWPDAKLSPNARPHFMAKATAAKDARRYAKYLSMLEVRTTDWKTCKSATIQPVFYSPKPARRDRDNHLAMCKPIFDGLADGGVIENDCGFTYKPPRFEIGERRLVLVITAE